MASLNTVTLPTPPAVVVGSSTSPSTVTNFYFPPEDQVKSISILDSSLTSSSITATHNSTSTPAVLQHRTAWFDTTLPSMGQGTEVVNSV